jgi:hypothetical protein
MNGELSPEAQAAAERAFEPFADAQRLSQTVEAFQEEKQHLFYSAARAAFIPRYVGDRQHTTGDDVRSAAREPGRGVRARGGCDRFLGRPGDTGERRSPTPSPANLAGGDQSGTP